MIYISYLGVYEGQNFERANTPNQIGSAFNAGFAVMVNAWRINNTLCVGTENDPIPVTDKYLQGPFTFINIQNVALQNWLATQPSELYPVYLPEITDRGLLSTVKYRCYGVISNYCTFIKRMRNEGVWY
jgi:hypothetical protein